MTADASLRRDYPRQVPRDYLTRGRSQETAPNKVKHAATGFLTPHAGPPRRCSDVTPSAACDQRWKLRESTWHARGWAQAVGEIFALTHFLRVIRDILLKGAGLTQTWPHPWPIALFLLAAGAIALPRCRETLD